MEAVSAKDTGRCGSDNGDKAKSPVIVDPKADCRKWYKTGCDHVDAIIAKKKYRTKITDALCDRNISGFTAEKTVIV